MAYKMVYINEQERISKWQQSTIAKLVPTYLPHFHSNFARIEWLKLPTNT